MAIVTILPFDTEGTKLSGLRPFYFDPATMTLDSDEPNECILRSATSPLDQQEYFTFGTTRITNVYDSVIPKETGKDGKQKPIMTISPQNQTARKDGVQILVKYFEVDKITDSEKPEFLKYSPQSWHVVGKIHIHEYSTLDDVSNKICRMIGMLFGSTLDTTRLNQLIRGQLRPTWTANP